MDAANGAQRDRRELGFLDKRRYVLHDRDAKFCALFRATLKAGGIKAIQLPARSPNLNAYAERWVRSVKEECLSKLILFGEVSLRRALAEFIDHFHSERNHQGKNNVLLFPRHTIGQMQAQPPSLSGPARRLAQILQSRRMNILTLRGHVRQQAYPLRFFHLKWL
jgi:Integrase core domain